MLENATPINACKLYNGDVGCLGNWRRILSTVYMCISIISIWNPQIDFYATKTLYFLLTLPSEWGYRTHLTKRSLSLSNSLLRTVVLSRCNNLTPATSAVPPEQIKRQHPASQSLLWQLHFLLLTTLPVQHDCCNRKGCGVSPLPPSCVWMRCLRICSKYTV